MLDVKASNDPLRVRNLIKAKNIGLVYAYFIYFILIISVDLVDCWNITCFFEGEDYYYYLKCNSVGK